MPVLVTLPEPRIELRYKEVRLADIAWRPCSRPDPVLVARCRRALREAATSPPSGTSNWDDLFQFLASYFGDQSSDVGVSEVVFMTADHPDEHEKYLGILDAAIAAAARSDPGVAGAIERSFATSARDGDEARSYLERLRAEYLRQYELAIQEHSLPRRD